MKGGVFLESLAESKNNLFKTFLNYAVPSVIAMVVSSAYVMIDGIFVGRGVGANALAAVNIAFPATILVTALVMAISIGGANLVSIRIGEGKPEEAQSVFSQCFAAMIIVAVVLSILGNIFAKPVSLLFGATDILLHDVMTFLRFYFIFCLPFVLSMGLSNFVRNDGAPRLSMYSQIAGGVATVAFNYTFVFIFKWGIAGSAIGSGCGQILALMVLLKHFIKKDGLLRIARPVFKKADLLKVTDLGFPTMLTELAMSFTTLCYNLTIIRRIGEIGVTAYSIVMYVMATVFMVLMGITIGLQPIISYNHGAKEKETVKKARRIGMAAATIVASILFVSMLLLGRFIVPIFNNESETLVTLAYTALVFFAASSIPAGLNMVNLTYFQATENPKISSVISFLRGFALILAGLFLLPNLFGNTGIWLTPIFCEGLTLLVTLGLARLIKPKALPEGNV